MEAFFPSRHQRYTLQYIACSVLRYSSAAILADPITSPRRGHRAKAIEQTCAVGTKGHKLDINTSAW